MTMTPEAWDGSAAPARMGVMRRFGVSPLVAVLIVVLLVFLVPPTIYLVQTSLYTTTYDGSFDQFTFRFYIELFTNPRFFNNLVNASIYAIGSAAVALTLGVLQREPQLVLWRRDNGLQYTFLAGAARTLLGNPGITHPAEKVK